MKKIEFESPFGQVIECDIRLKNILCIVTSFDPFRYIDLAENIATSQEIESFPAIGYFLDNTGYWLFRLVEDFDSGVLLDDISVWFNDYKF